MATEQLDFLREFAKVYHAENRREAAILARMMELMLTKEEIEVGAANADAFLSLRDRTWEELTPSEQGAFIAQCQMFMSALAHCGMKIVPSVEAHGTPH